MCLNYSNKVKNGNSDYFTAFGLFFFSLSQRNNRNNRKAFSFIQSNLSHVFQTKTIMFLEKPFCMMHSYTFCLRRRFSSLKARRLNDQRKSTNPSYHSGYAICCLAPKQWAQVSHLPKMRKHRT